MRHFSSLGVLLAGLTMAGSVTAQQYDRPYDQPYEPSGYGVATLEERVGQLEKRLSASSLVEMANKMDQMRSEVSKLRGRVEELEHELAAAKKRQQDMYSDLDRRIPPSPSAPVSAPEHQAPPPTEAGSVAPTAPPSPVNEAAQPAAPPPSPAPAKPATPPAPKTAAPVIDSASRQAAYQHAFTTLKDGQYNDAIKQFKSFVATYPSGELVDNAYYWLGEAHYVNREFGPARETFRKVLKDYPQSNKAADALLKLGYIEYDNGQYPQAKEILADVGKRYPSSSAAKAAEKKLEKMRQEKR